MPRRLLAALAFAGFALAMPHASRAQDGIFGSFLSGFSRTSEARSANLSDAQIRDRETRNLRREYWEREQRRLTRDASAQTIATR